MGAREDILSAVKRRTGSSPHPERYVAPRIEGSLPERFAERATAEFAEVRFLERMTDVPDVVAEILRQRNLPAAIHVPPNRQIEAFPWGKGLELLGTPPGADDAALAIAPFAIAETGTLVYSAAPDAPASWHFRPGLEIAVVAAANILPHLEDVLARLSPLASTVNLVTGPSRTGDIEQTMELGAHGPKALSILVVKG